MNAEELGVLVGVDGSQCARQALDWATADAAARGTGLMVVTVADLPRLADVPLSTELLAAATDGARRTARDAAARARDRGPGVAVETRVTSGNPAVELLTLAEGAEVVVVGSRGHGGLAALLLGSTAGHVAAHARRPVVVVRERITPAGRVLVGIDGSGRTDAVLEFAFAHAERHGLPLHAVGAYLSVGEVVPVVPYPLPAHLLAEDLAEARAECERRTAEAVERWSAKHPQVSATWSVAEGAATRVLTEASEDAGLLVVGSRGHGGFAGLVLGSVSQAVVRHAHCPVAVVH